METTCPKCHHRFLAKVVHFGEPGSIRVKCGWAVESPTYRRKADLLMTTDPAMVTCMVCNGSRGQKKGPMWPNLKKEKS